MGFRLAPDLNNSGYEMSYTEISAQGMQKEFIKEERRKVFEPENVKDKIESIN